MYCIDDITLVIGLERCKFRTAGYDIAIQFFRNRLKCIRPYTFGERIPVKFRFGPLITTSFIFLRLSYC